MAFNYKSVSLEWLGHDAFKIKGSKIVYIDVYKIKEQKEKANILLITHEHFDHLSREDIRKVISKETVIVAPEICRSELEEFENKKEFVKSNQTLTIENVKIETYPAYNINKFREPGKVFHPKEDGRVSYVVELDNVRIFHAGDSDFIEEFKNLKNIDIALLPVSGTYVMTWKEAVEVALSIKPKVAIPMHYGAIVGSKKDAENFRKELEGKINVFVF